MDALSFLSADFRFTREHPYMQVTHIPFRRTEDGDVIVDRFWAIDLRQLSDMIGHVRIAAPVMPAESDSALWGTSWERIGRNEAIEFIALPDPHRDGWRVAPHFLSILKKAAGSAVLVHSSNVFGRYVLISLFHRWCGKRNIPTIYIQPEDFSSMLRWEWARQSGVIRRMKRTLAVNFYDSLARQTAATADITFCFGGGAADMLRPAAKNIVVIYHAIHNRDQCISDVQLNERSAMQQSGRPLHLIMAVRHAGLKGIDHAIHAIALLRDAGRNVSLKVLGRGPDTAQYVALAQALDVSDRVSFPGAKTHGPELFEHLYAADVAMMPHRTNDFGRAAFDAMAAGLPIIAYDTPTASSVVRDNVDGLIVSLDDITELADTVARIDDDRALLTRLAQASAARGQRQTLEYWNQYRLRHIRTVLADKIDARLASFGGSKRADGAMPASTELPAETNSHHAV